MSSGERLGKHAQARSHASDTVSSQNVHTGHCPLEVAARKESDVDSLFIINPVAHWRYATTRKAGMRRGGEKKKERQRASEGQTQKKVGR